MKKEYKILFLLVSVIVGCTIIGEVILEIPREILSYKHSGFMGQFATTLNDIGNYINTPLANIFQITIICSAFWIIIMLRHKIRSAIWKLEGHI
ncbi:MAG TPA: hypothetical protein VGR54_05480 [Nitrosopumilaceae archaeon]|nr:hypothetical protein [Nitrosopumilaceae archaeon]